MKSYLKTMGVAGVWLFLLSAAALAGTKYYVNDTLTIPVRTGQALDRKIIALPAVGQEMEVLKAEKYEDELTKLLWNKNIKWFLSGTGVLILGFIIGFSTKRQRRPSSLL